MDSMPPEGEDGLIFAPDREYDGVAAADPSKRATPFKTLREDVKEFRKAVKSGRFSDDTQDLSTQPLASIISRRIAALNKVLETDGSIETVPGEDIALFRDVPAPLLCALAPMAPVEADQTPVSDFGAIDDTPLPSAAITVPGNFIPGWSSNFFDFRGNILPRGVTLIGAASFERQPDSSTALALEPGAYLHLDLSTGSMIPAKSSKHTVLVLEVFYPQLPRDAAPLIVYNPAFHAALDRSPDGDVLVSYDGGVGALGRFGLGALAFYASSTSAPPAVSAGAWCRVIVARHSNLIGEWSVTTFVNGKLAAQITDAAISTERFSIARNSIDLFRTSRTGMQVPVKIRVAVVCASLTAQLPPDSVSSLIRTFNKTTFALSPLKLKREALDTRLFANLSLASLYKRPPPMWMHPLFLYSLSAPLLSFASSAPATLMGDYLHAFHLVLRGMIASVGTTTVLDGLDDSHRESLASVLHTFSRALPLAKRFPCGTRAGVAASINYHKHLLEAVWATRTGEMTLLPLALTKAINGTDLTAGFTQQAYFVIFDRTTEDYCSLTFVNASLDTGLAFHPSSAATPGELQCQLSLTVDKIPLARALDGGFWTALVAMIDPLVGTPVAPQNDLYGRLIPTLTGVPLAETLAAASADTSGVRSFSPLPLLAGSPATLCFEALRFMLRRRGLSRDHTRLVGFAFQARLLELAHSDVVCFPRLSDMDARALLAAIGSVAGEAARLSRETKLIGTATIANVCSSLHDLRAGIESLRTEYSSSVPPMAHLDDGGVARSSTQHSLFPSLERFVRLEGVDGLAGAADKAEDATPFDLMRLPVRAQTFDEITQAILYTQEQVILASNESQVRNRSALVITLIEHLVTRILPIPKSIHAPEEERINCIWQADIDYSKQSRLSYALSRLSLNFTVAIRTSVNSTALDYTRLVVSAALAVMCDSILRRRTLDYQSPVALAILEGRFGTTPGALAEQTATAIGAYPELQVVRAHILHYFNDTAAQHTVFAFRGNYFSSTDLELSRDVNLRLSLGRSRKRAAQGLLFHTDCEAPAMESYPEYCSFRDVCLYFSFLQRKTDKVEFYRDRPQPQAVDLRSYDDRTYSVYFMDGEIHFTDPPALRFQPGASPAALTGMTGLQTEDDVLHVPSLPNFAGALGQADAELLLSFLTVPYLRIPLVLGFFATEERINALKSSKLCTLLEAVLFEPGAFLTPPVRRGLAVQRTLANGSLSRLKPIVEPEVFEAKTAADEEMAALNEPTVPVKESISIATGYGYLMNELRHAPGNILSSTSALLDLALALDIGTVQSSSVSIILYVIRTAARIANYASFVQRQMDMAASKAAGALCDTTLASVECPEVIPVTDEHRLALSEGLKRLRRQLWGKIQQTLNKWGAELYVIVSAGEAGGSDDIESEQVDDADDKKESNDDFNDDNDNDEGQPLSYPSKSRPAGAADDEDDSDFLASTQRSRHALGAAKRLTGSDRRARDIVEDQKALKKLSVNAATRLLCTLHAHTVLLFRNVDSVILDLHPVYGAALLTAMLFLTTRHSFGQDTLCVTEHVIFEAMHTVRRTLVAWLRRLSEPALGLIMEAVIRVVTCEGVLDMRLAEEAVAAKTKDAAGTDVPTEEKTPANVATTSEVLAVPGLLRRTSSLGGRTHTASGESLSPSDITIEQMTALLGSASTAGGARRVWRFVPGPACTGRFVSVDLATDASVADAPETALQAGCPALSGDLSGEGVGRNALWSQVRQGMTVDTQAWQLTLKGSQLQALPPEFLNDDDVNATCGSRSMQAALTETTKHRKVYRIVGRNYDIARWTPDRRGEYFEAERLYDVQELHPHEHWVADIFEPVRLAFFEVPPPPLMIFMPTQSLPKNASVAYLVGMHPGHHGAWKEFFVYKHRRIVEIYTVTTYGRRFYRTLDYSTNANFSLRCLSVDTMDRDRPWAEWERHAAGNAKRNESLSDSTIVVTRGPECVENLSGTMETFVPARFLSGLLPEGLVEQYDFWQDDRDSIRGYARQSDTPKLTTAIFVELLRASRCDGTEEPGVSARVTRMPRKLMEQRARGVAAPSISVPSGTDTGALEDEELELVNLLHAPKYSQTYQIATVLSRIEGLSHVLAWKRVAAEPTLAGSFRQTLHMDPNEAVSAASAAATGHSKLKLAKLASDEAAEAAALKACETELLDLPLIELPRLKMSFHTRISDDGECRLYSLDHADLYVSNARSDDLESITAGIPHSLIMSNDMGELSMLVPCVSVVRPSIASSPLSTEIVLERNDLWWNLVLDTRYFIYPIHVSLSFVFTPTLASALYLMLLRLLHRDYAEVFRLADTIGSDSDLSSEERHLLLTLGEANSDTHADACACRIKITLAVMDSQDARLPWAMLPVYSIYSQRISTLSAACRLPLNDEVRFARAAVTPAVCSRLLRFNRACRSVLPPRWVPLAIMAYNRLQCIEAMVYGRPAYRTMTLPVPAVECIYTADLGSVEELLFTSGHEALLSDEVKSHIRGKVVRAFQRPAKQVYRPLRNVASAELLTVAARFLAHSETSGNMANGALGFLYVYQLLQGDVRARAASRECAFGLGVFAASMLPLGRYCRLTALLKLMVQRPDVAQVLPRWSAFCKSNRGSEMTFESSGGNKPVPVEGLADFFKQAIDTLARLYKASPLFVAAPFGHATASAATETIRGQFRAPARVGLVQKVGARSWVTPQLSNYDCSSRYLIAASSAMSDDDPETVSALERHVHLQGLGRKAGDSSVAATLKRALRDWDHLQKKGQRHFSSEYWAQLGSEASRGLQTLVGTVLGDLNVDQEVIKRAFVANRDDTFTELPINVRAHPGVQSGVALAMQSRLEKDMELFVAARNVSSETFVKGLTDSDVSGLVGTGLVPPTVSAAGTVAGLKENFESLVRRMTAVKSDDERAVRHAFGLVKRLSQCTLDVRKSGDAFAERLFGRNSQVAETIASLTADESVAVERHMHHWLLVLAGNEPELQLEYIIGALLSSRAVFDLRKINPFLTDDMITVMFSFVEAALLRANRIGHINRTLGELRSLIKLLDKVNAASSGGASGGQGDAALIAGVVQKSKAVGTHLTAAHHYFTPITAEQAAEQEGVEAVAEITSLAKCGDFLFAAQIPEEHLCGTATADAVANEAAALSHEAAIASWVSSNSESSKSKPLSRNMGLCCVLEAAKIRTLWGHGLRGESIPSFHGSLEKFAHGGAYGVSRAAQAGIILPTGASDKHGAVEYDPRFLVFEFTWNIMLRKSQVAMVRDFADNIRAGKSIVKQMIMGAGKTTVVAPLLTLMFGDGKSLVMEVVPPALLEFSRSIMRSTFSTVMYKRVFTFHFDRATIPHASMLTKLRSAVAARGVVISTPTSVKSVMLKLLETQQHLMDLTLPRTRELEHERDVLVAMLREFQDGVLLMDEVDMILHPLKSELNFPVGAKHELDFDPLRWKLAMHVLDAVYYRSTPVVPADFRDSKAALGLLEQISAAIGTGLLERHMQSSPHTVLLNTDFYYTSILPLMCDWVMLWIEAQHLTGITSAQLREYLMTPGTHGLELASAVEHGVTPHFRKMINLARDWLRSYLPHVLQKIDRVSFGLLSEDDYARAIKNDPNIPETRAKLAIPFLGKDVPSETSEFAHPDVIIGLTYMAYRYEGLRYADFCEIIDSMHSSLSKELGPYLKRPSVLRYARWVHEATGQIRGESPPLVAPLAATAADDEEAVEVIDTRPEVMPLRLLKRSNVDHMQALFDLVIREPLVIQWYLNDFVFPAHLRHQKIKLSASGVEVGGDMLFSRRVGFSGTPSDLLPLELGKCDYEKGTDGMMVHVLTSSQMVGASYVEEDWSVRSLLKRVATQTNPAGEPMFQALIDTGALITGFSNKGVAEYLLEHGLAWADGVVFLDELDRKMVLVRATKRVVKLAQCGIPAEKRFAFYDQVHTTGMDISHRLDACAALTLGKDMTFRDYAQGAYRMRGLSKGQTIHLLVTPEIARLIQRQLELAAGGPRPVIASTVGTPAALLESVVAWLVINAMQSEQTQFNQLAIQNVTNVWRKNAFKDLIANAKYFGLDTFPVDPAVAAEHKAKKTRIARQVAQALKEAGHGDTEDVNKQKRKNERRAAHRRMHKQRLAIRAEFIAKIRADGNSEASFVQNLPEYRKQIEELLRARRKEQFRAAMLGYASDESSIGAASGATAAVQGPAPVEPTVPRNSAIEAALEVFEEDVNFALEEGVPRIVPFNESLQSRIDHNKRFIASSAESAICAETVHSVMRSAGDTLQLLALTAEMVQTVEEERERAVEQEQESEIEVEKFVDQSYARDNEVQTPWPLSLLRHAPNDASHPVEVPPFYSASLFTVPGAAGISLPRSLYISNNYYDRRWTGSRRVKNATMYLEYSPKTGAGAGVLETWLATTGPASLAARLDGPSGVELASQLATAFDLFDIDGSGDLNEEEAAHFVSAVTTERLEHSRSVVAQLFRAMGTASLTRVQVEKLLCEGALHAGEAGRFFICLSLREAESLRWWMHKRAGKGLFDDEDVDIVLRCSANDNSIIDAVHAPYLTLALGAPSPAPVAVVNSVMAATSSLAAAHASMVHCVWQAVRYLNCETYFSTADITTLLSVVDQHDAAARLCTFSAVQACRRRARRKWHETPVARLFNVGYNSRLHALKARAISFRIRHILRERRFSAMDAFRAFDYNHNGLLSPDEFMGGISWLGLDQVVAIDDVVDLIGFSERKDGNLQAKDFGDLLRDPSLADDRVGAAKQHHLQLLQQQQQPGDVPAMPADDEDIGGLDDADLPTVLPARSDDILRAWSSRAVADLVSSTANAGAVPSAAVEESKDVATSEAPTAPAAVSENDLLGVTIGRDELSRQQWIELDFSLGIPQCVKCEGNVTWVAPDAPGNHERVGYLKCSNMGGFVVTIPSVGPFQKYPSSRTMSKYTLLAHIRFPSLPPAKLSDEGNNLSKKVLAKRRPLFSASTKEGTFDIAAASNAAFPSQTNVRCYESHEPLNVNTWEALGHYYCQSTAEVWLAGRIIRHWGTFKNIVHQSFRVGLPADETGKSLGPNESGHEFHIRHLSLRSMGRNQPDLTQYSNAYLKSQLKWGCTRCGVVNSNTTTCAVCGIDKAHGATASAHASQTRHCPLCFHANAPERTACARCNTDLGELQGDDDAGAGAGGVAEAGVDDCDVTSLGIEGDEGDAKSGEGNEGDEGDDKDDAASEQGELMGDDEDDGSKAAELAARSDNAQLKTARNWRGGAVQSLLAKLNIKRTLFNNELDSELDNSQDENEDSDEDQDDAHGESA